MTRTQRLPLGNMLLTAASGRGDLTPDARLMGATQARVPMPSATGLTPGRGHALASLFNGSDDSSATPVMGGGMLEPMAVPQAGASGPSRGQMMADMVGGGGDIFGPRPRYGTPPIWGGYPSPDLDGISDVPDVDTITAKPKFFDKDGGHRQVIGILGDMLAGAVGAPPRYAQMMEQRRQQEVDDTRADRRDTTRRQAERDEWTWRENYKRKNPDDQLTSYMVAAGIDPQSPEARQLYRRRAESMTAPPLMAVDGYDAQGNPTKTFMPRTGPGTGGQPQQAGPPAGTVRNGFRFTGGNPNDRASWVPVGGASPDGGATFR